MPLQHLGSIANTVGRGRKITNDIALKPTIILTGSSRGIGKKLFGKLTKDFTIVPVVRSSSDVNSASVTWDMSRPLSQRTELDIHDRLRKSNSVVGLIHCAGVTGIDDAMSDQDVFNVNTISLLSLTDLVLPYLLEHRGSRPPYILNLTTGAAVNPILGLRSYCASKAASLMALRVLASGYPSDQLSVISVAPGIVETQMVRAIMRSKEIPLATRAWFGQQATLGRWKTAQQSANEIISVLRCFERSRSLHGNLLDLLDSRNPQLIDLSSLNSVQYSGQLEDDPCMDRF
jgi:short-subunit dehydrogenase